MPWFLVEGFTTIPSASSGQAQSSPVEGEEGGGRRNRSYGKVGIMDGGVTLTPTLSQDGRGEEGEGIKGNGRPQGSLLRVAL